MSVKRIYRGVISVTLSIMIAGSLISCSKSTAKNTSGSNFEINGGISLSSGNEADDAQAYISTGNHNIAKGENGYYYLSNGNTNIMYFDKETCMSFPLCGKADCSHNDESCNSYLGTSHVPGTIYFYRGFIYIMSVNEGNIFLERINADGSSRQNIGIICPENDDQSVELVFHEDFVYVLDKSHGNVVNDATDNTEEIKKYSLDGKFQGNIFEYTGTNIIILNGKSYGDKLFFEIRTVFRDSNNNLVGKQIGLFAYDYILGKVDKIIDADVYDYSIDTKNGAIYYFITGDGLYRYSMGTNENNKIYQADEEMGSGKLSFDGKYLYVNNNIWCISQRAAGIKNKLTPKCLVMDLEGAIINTINSTGILSMYFGGDDYIFAEKTNISSKSGLAYINKKDIANAKSWTMMETAEK